MIPNAKLLREFNMNIILLSKNRSKIKCCLDNKGVYCCWLIDGKISMKPIKTPSAPIKPCEDSDHHQVGTWTLECKMWNLTTEKLITPSFDMIESVIENYWKLPLSCVLGLLIKWDIYFNFWYEYISCSFFDLINDETNLSGTPRMYLNTLIV